jgi:hypothetical protein
MATSWHANRTFSGGSGTPAQARRFCADHLSAALGDSVDAVDTRDDTLLVVSELVTNAVNCGCSAAVVDVELHRTYLRVSVTDDCSGQPKLTRAEPSDSHGRGLSIITQLSRSWGVLPNGAGKEVWAELAMTSPPITVAVSDGTSRRL